MRFAFRRTPQPGAQWWKAARSFFPLPTLAALILLAGCAVPVAPSGGPPDSAPPILAESDPAAEAVRVGGDTIVLTFNEYIDARSLPGAFDLTPALDGVPTFEWRRRSVTITLPEPLREETTYRLTLGTDLRDANGVRLKQPITLAFSTGDTVSRGRLEGRIVESERGAGAPNLDVFAYPAGFAGTDTLARGAKPLYRTQTGADGRFSLEYLEERAYYVVALRDRNRSRTLDPSEPFAAPPEPTIFADSAFVAPEVPWLLATRDETPPEAERVRSRSSQRFEVRFSEAVVFPADSARAFSGWQIEGRPGAIRAVTAVDGDRRGAFVWTAPRAGGVVDTLALSGALRDSAGLWLAPARLAIPPSSAPDTTTARLAALLPEADGDLTILLPGESPEARFTRPPEPWLRADSATRPRSLASWLRLEDSSGAARASSVSTGDGIRFRVRPSPALAPGDTLTLRVVSPALGDAPADTLGTQRFARASPRALGALSAIVAFAGSTRRASSDSLATPLALPGERRVWAELLPTGDAPSGTAVRRALAQPDGLVLFDALPEGAIYRIRAWEDRDGDGAWTGGRAAPHTPAEPLVWSAPLEPVRARWETVLPDTLMLRAPQ